MSEKITSVEDEILSYQEGQGASKIATGYSFIPCAIETPIGVVVTPVTIADSANKTAFPSVVEVLSLEVLSVVADLDAWVITATAIEIGTIVRATLVGGTEKAYIANAKHTSQITTIDADVALGLWDEVNCETFLKLVHTSAGAAKVANFTYLINGYKVN